MFDALTHLRHIRELDEKRYSKEASDILFKIALCFSNMPQATKAGKLVHVATILDHTNTLLGMAIPQGAKKTLCTMLETTLMADEFNVYNGFNNNYWLTKGCADWKAAGSREDDDKHFYIIGSEGVTNKRNDDFVSDMEGEYSRTYYKSHRLQQAQKE